MSPLAEKYDQARIATLDVLTSLTTGKIGVLLAARQLAALRFTLVGDKLDDEWRIFVAIDSETDHLPTGKERIHWQGEALAEKDIEIKESELFYHDKALAAAYNLIRRYENGA
ncbi:MAG TPA: hypothetical protein VL357_11925 [Rariglobus sp.]|jgi:hypothetical protein|nr:hypothetical protein [Rariglobus sp.]